MDTGAPYVIFSPQLAEDAGIDPAAALVDAALLIRGREILGGLHRVTLELPAVIGNNLALEVTAFIPDAARNFGETHPSFLGLFGCLESIRFAVDLQHTQMFFFGPRPAAAA